MFHKEAKISLKKELTLGADPEIFVFDGLKLLPAFQFLPPKEAGSDIYWDGFQAEWKLDYTGRHCQNNMVYFMREALMNLHSLAKQHSSRARLSAVNVVRIKDEILQKADVRHVELGCMPSFNAYRLKGTPVLDPRKLTHRFAGGHMHFGEWTIPPPYKKIVKTLDNILGIFSIGAARHIDNPIRRQYYGLPGEYRMPKYEGNAYGVEYRTLSNFWITAPSIQQLIWDLGRMAVRLSCSPKYGKLWATNEDEVKETILHSDVKQAERIIQRNLPMLNWMLKQRYSDHATEKALQVFHQGIESVIPDVNDFPENWHFGDEWIPNGGRSWARWETYSRGR